LLLHYHINMDSLKKTILIVEDEALMLSALAEKLNTEGFNTLQAKDGEEGLKTALRERPDLILLDILMPRLNGLAMMRKLRSESDWGKRVPIIFLTNLSPDEESIIEIVTKEEPTYYLVKTDWSLDEVADKIRERLG